MTAKYRIKQYQHSGRIRCNSHELLRRRKSLKLERVRSGDTDAKLDAIMSANSKSSKGRDDYDGRKAQHRKNTGVLQMKFAVEP